MPFPDPSSEHPEVARAAETASEAPPRRSWVEQVMGLPVSVLARGSRARSADADDAVQAVYADLREADRVFSPYRPDSVVSRLGRGELDWDHLDPIVLDVADRCRQAKSLTHGLFDATRPDGWWDPSGLVKGWAVERASRHLGRVGALDWCLNAGGDVTVLCPSGKPFTVGIQDPRDDRRVATAVPCVSGAVATSGTAARGAHLYDPGTGRPVTGRWLSVSVRGPSLETADVLATAAFVAGDRWPDVLAAAPGYEGLGITAAGALHATAGWSASEGTGQ
ncbi:MAG TPA: FAD:protein FMN transferase [Kribbella sp.]|nr:FAD:protein FMN transferase [Kribbella sp.]